jgi:DNA-binding NarL/FixJ family response regulator
MFKKILVVDPFYGVSMAVSQKFNKIFSFEISNAKYFDEGYLKIKRGLFDNEPYDLLISDLSFKNEYRNTKFQSGEEFIVAIKEIQPNIKTIVFSEENKSFRINSLFNKSKINAFVYKGRNSIPELIKAVQIVFTDDIKNPLFGVSNTFGDKTLVEIEEYDISLLKLLSFGFALDDIVLDFQKIGIVPNGYSSIEKRINKLRADFCAKNKVHLIAIAKDMGLV